MEYFVGDYVKTTNGKSGKIRTIYNRTDVKIVVILLKTNSCYVCPISMILYIFESRGVIWLKEVILLV